MTELESVRLVSIDRYNWESLLELQLHPEQEQYLPPMLYSLAQSRFEDLTPTGITLDEKMVGMIMYGKFSGICWINRIIVDKDFQGRGIGRKALRLLINRLKTDPACAEIRASYHRNNDWADHLFGKEGFKAISPPVGDELVVTYRGA